jgi:hypothetical protein
LLFNRPLTFFYKATFNTGSPARNPAQQRYSGGLLKNTGQPANKIHVQMKQLSFAPPATLQRWFWLLLAINCLFIIGSKWYMQPLATGEIVRFELAKDLSVAERIIQEWVTYGKLNHALISIYLDFLFILLYTSGLAVTCVYLGKLTGHEILMRTGKFFTYLLIIAGICDVIENITMLKSLQGTATKWSVLLTYDMATTKFSIVILSALFIAVCLVFRLFRKVEV